MVIKRSINGFTLFEIVVAMGILAIGILGILALFPVGMDSQKRASDYTQVMQLAQWKMTDIQYRSHVSALATGSFPTTSPDPQPFTQSPLYGWHYYVTKPYTGTLNNLFRVDLLIYSADNSATPIERIVSYIENP